MLNLYQKELDTLLNDRLAAINDPFDPGEIVASRWGYTLRPSRNKIDTYHPLYPSPPYDPNFT